jgi:hypothetical protein
MKEILRLLSLVRQLLILLSQAILREKSYWLQEVTICLLIKTPPPGYVMVGDSSPDRDSCCYFSACQAEIQEVLACKH